MSLPVAFTHRLRSTPETPCGPGLLQRPGLGVRGRASGRAAVWRCWSPRSPGRGPCPRRHPLGPSCPTSSPNPVRRQNSGRRHNLRSAMCGPDDTSGTGERHHRGLTAPASRRRPQLLRQHCSSRSVSERVKPCAYVPCRPSDTASPRCSCRSGGRGVLLHRPVKPSRYPRDTSLPIKPSRSAAKRSAVRRPMPGFTCWWTVSVMVALACPDYRITAHAEPSPGMAHCRPGRSPPGPVETSSSASRPTARAGPVLERTR